MKSILLDTNGFVALFKGDQSVLEELALADCVYASVIAIGELEAGFRGGSKYRKNIEILERFLSKPTVETLQVTRETSDYFGRIKNALKKKGTPIPLNDVWLSAHCLEKAAVLITYDRHFSHVPGLRMWHNIDPEIS